MYTYIKQSISKPFLTFEQPLNAEEYDNIGESWEDYLDNKWVLLNADQVQFHEENPDASILEVWNMQLTPAWERTITQAKKEKLHQIKAYDSSKDVNSFIVSMQVDGEMKEISGWLTPAERSNYRSSIDAAKLTGIEMLSFYINDAELTISTTAAELMLAQIQLYADQCFMITKQHEAAVKSLSTIQEVDEYDNTVDYPQKLVFTV